MMLQNAIAVLDVLSEPAFLLEPAGRIRGANRAAQRLVGARLTGGDIRDFLAGPSEGFFDYLRRCSATTNALPGSAAIRRLDGSEVRLRAYGARLRGSDEDSALIAMRFKPRESDGFSMLARKIRDLNSEIHQRRRAQAALEEALCENETLLRELQHRVKNNMQMLLGLFSAAQRETKFEEVRIFLDEVAYRLMALATVQQLMYQSSDVHSVEATAFIRGLCEAIGRSVNRQVGVQVSVFEGYLANDVVFPLALILNELLTNAYKHASHVPNCQISVDLRKGEASYTLTVQDNGPGIRTGGSERHSSGLGLVRGLCRQIGGSLTIESDHGTRCIVRFADPYSQRNTLADRL